jgi:hypothetical protein
MAGRDELQHWLDTLAMEAAYDETHAKVHAAATQLAAVLDALPPSHYRELATCKLSDAIAMTFVAARPQ